MYHVISRDSSLAQQIHSNTFDLDLVFPSPSQSFLTQVKMKMACGGLRKKEIVNKVNLRSS